MATTTIFDVVKVSELPVVRQLTDGDYLIINDNDPSNGTATSKVILIDDLAIASAERTNLRELKDVKITSPKSGQVIRWDGSAWVNDMVGGDNVILSDFTVRNNNVDSSELGGRLEYDSRFGVFTFHKADTTGPLSNHRNVSPLTDQANNKDTLSWSSSAREWLPEPAIKITALNLPPIPYNNKGKIEVNGYRLDYTPPDVSQYLLRSDFIEEDPVFKASPSFLIGATDIARWHEAYSWDDHARQGYIKSLKLQQLDDVRADSPADGDTLIFNSIVNTWFAGHPRITGITRIEDVEVTAPQDNQVLTYESRTNKWKNKDANLSTTPELIGSVSAGGVKVLSEGLNSHNFTVSKTPDLSLYDVKFTEQNNNTNYIVSLTSMSTASGFCIATVLTKRVDGFIVQTVNLESTAQNNDAAFQFTVTFL